MEDYTDSTAIVRSLKELHRVLNVDQSKYSKTPCAKLNFSDTLNETGASNVNESALNISGIDIQPSRSSLFLKKHQDNVAGFDVTKRIREKDSDIVLLQANITHLESRIQHLQTANEKNSLAHDEEISIYRGKQMRDKELIDELQRKNKKLEMREKDLFEEKIQVQKLVETNSAHLMNKLTQMKLKHSEQENKSFEELAAHRNHIIKLESELKEVTNSTMASHSLGVEDQMKVILNKVANFEKNQMEMDALMMKLSRTTLENKELKSRLDRVEDYKSQYQQFESKITKIPALEKQVMKLKEENNLLKITAINVDLINEKLTASEERCKLLESRMDDLIVENANLITTHEPCERYELAIQEELGLKCMPPVSELKELLSLLKKGDKELCDSIQILRESVHSHEATQNEQEKVITSLNEQLAKGQEDISKNVVLIRRLQRKLMLISKERDNLKGIISSYEAESTMMPANLERERISTLETQLEGYKNEVSRLEKDLDRVQGLQSSSEPTQGESQRISELELRIEELVRAKEELGNKLEYQKVQGAFDPNNTRILEFKENPAAIAKRERQRNTEQLQKENETLKSRVKLLEAGETMDLTFKTGEKVKTDVPSTKQVQELEEKLASLEKQNKRLMEVFRQKSQQLREVVYRLTGYRFDIKEDNCKIINIYANSQDEYLLFQQDNDGDLRLLENEYSNTLDHLIDTYLHKANSYPAFLSALNLDLFNARTIVPSPEESSDEEEGEEHPESEGEGEGEEEREQHVDEEEEEEVEEEEEEEEAGADGEVVEEEEEEVEVEEDDNDDGEEEGDEDDDDEDEEEDDSNEGEEREDGDGEGEYDEEEEEYGERNPDEEDEEEDEDEQPPTKRTRRDEDDDDDDDDDGLICLD